MNKLLVIIPAYNESENILGVIEELKRDIQEADILVINDCSKDNTEQLLKENAINYMNTPFNLGYAGVVQTGFKYAMYKGYEYVAQFDGDGQHVAKELAKLYEVARTGNADIIIGSRFKEKTEYNHAFFRRLGTWMFQKVIKYTTKQEISDPTSGMQVLNKKVYYRYAKINNYPEYPDANLLTEMLLEGYQVEEVSVVMRERMAGVSMHAGILKPCKYMIRMFYSLIIIICKYMKIKNKNKCKGGSTVANQ